jgi:hypothetical protein
MDMATNPKSSRLKVRAHRARLCKLGPRAQGRVCENEAEAVIEDRAPS